MPEQRWLILAELFLARTAIGFQFQSVGALSPFLVRDFAIDYAQLGLLIGSYLLPGIAIAYPGGLLGQRFGDKRVVLCGLALMVLGGALTGLGNGYAMFLAGRIVGGIGAVLVNVLLTKMGTDWFVGREIGTALALLVGSWPIGIGLALVTLPGIAAAISPAAAFDVTAVLAGVLLVMFGALYRDPVSALPVSVARFGLSPRELGLVSLAGLIWALFNVGFVILVSFAPPMLVARGMPAADAGLATSLATWTVVLSIPLGGALVDRTGRASSLMTASFAIIGMGMLLLPVGASLGLIAAIGIVSGLPVGAMMALPAEVLSPASRGPGMGIFFTWYYVGMAALVPLAGLARDLTGLPGAPLAFGGTLQLLTIAVLGFFRLTQRRSGIPGQNPLSL